MEFTVQRAAAQYQWKLMDLTKAQFQHINMPYEHKKVFDCQYLGADTQSLTG